MSLDQMRERLRDAVRRLLQFREEAHKEAERMKVDTARFQILRPPGESEGFESCDELRFPKPDTDER